MHGIKQIEDCLKFYLLLLAPSIDKASDPFQPPFGRSLISPASGLTGGLLTMIGYSAATAFDPEVTMGIFNISCIAPAIGFVAVALSLFFIYPLTKQKVEENVAALAQRHNK